MKIAILHEMLIKTWGAEKVASELIELFPDADMYTLIYDESRMKEIFPKSRIHPSCFKLKSQRIYSLTKKQRLCLPFMARSVEALNFSDYDRVIVSSSGFAHGLKVWENTKTIIYYHAPARYMWDWAHEYRRDIGMNHGIKLYFYGKMMKNLRTWDYEASQKNDILLSNSATTQKRISKYYRRESEIVFPPIETERFEKKVETAQGENYFWENSYYIILSALTEFKKLDVAINAFKNMPDVNLLIIWSGEHKEALKNISHWSQNIIFAWAKYWDELVYLVQNSLGLIFPGEEDFGIVPIEVMAAGKPIFALHKWWLTETVIAWSTGDFFIHSDGSDFIEKFSLFHKNNQEKKYSPQACKKQAKKYDKEIFKKKIQLLLK